MTLYHITLWDIDFQNEIIPRIPEKSGIGEDTITARISMAPSIMECIRGLGDIEFWKYDNRIKAYQFEIEKNDSNLVDWRELYIKGMVLDTPLTREHWYKKSVSPIKYFEYYVNDVICKYHIIVRNETKNQIVQIIQESGEVLSEELKLKTPIEIIDAYRGYEIIELIKEKLRHKVIDYTEDSAQIFKAIFGQEPDRFHYEPYYNEYKYIDNCSLEIIRSIDMKSGGNYGKNNSKTFE